MLRGKHTHNTSFGLRGHPWVKAHTQKNSKIKREKKKGLSPIPQFVYQKD